jgi:hypothetical protein
MQGTEPAELGPHRSEFVDRRIELAVELNLSELRIGHHPALARRRERRQGTAERERRHVGIARVEFPRAVETSSGLGQSGLHIEQPLANHLDLHRVILAGRGPGGGNCQSEAGALRQLRPRRLGVDVHRHAREAPRRVHRGRQRAVGLEGVDRRGRRQSHEGGEIEFALAPRPELAAGESDLRLGRRLAIVHGKNHGAFQIDGLDGEIHRQFELLEHAAKHGRRHGRGSGGRLGGGSRRRGFRLCDVIGQTSQGGRAHGRDARATRRDGQKAGGRRCRFGEIDGPALRDQLLEHDVLPRGGQNRQIDIERRYHHRRPTLGDSQIFDVRPMETQRDATERHGEARLRGQCFAGRPGLESRIERDPDQHQQQRGHHGHADQKKPEKFHGREKKTHKHHSGCGGSEMSEGADNKTGEMDETCKTDETDKTYETKGPKRPIRAGAPGQRPGLQGRNRSSSRSRSRLRSASYGGQAWLRGRAFLRVEVNALHLQIQTKAAREGATSLRPYPALPDQPLVTKGSAWPMASRMAANATL